MISARLFKSIPLTLWMVCFCFFYSDAQYLRNPSLESVYLSVSTPIDDWTSCIQTPDMQPGNWNVTLPAFNGNSYIGLGKTDYYSGSETISQVMNMPISKDSVYYFSFYNAWQPNNAQYMPGTSFTFPGFMYMQMGTSLCSRKNKILQTADFTFYSEWKQTCAIFKPDSNFSSISFTPWGYDAYRYDEINFPPNGYGKYLLMDNLELTSVQNKLSYTLKGPNSACLNQSVALTLTGLPTCLGVGFQSPTLTLPTGEGSILSILCSTLGVHSISGYAQTGTVTSWPVYHVLTVTSCPLPLVPTITGTNVVCAGATATYTVTTQAGVQLNLQGFQNLEGLATWSVPGVNTLTAIAFNNLGTVSGFKIVTVTDCSPPMQPTIRGPNTICSGVSDTFQISTQSGVTLSLRGFQNQLGLALWTTTGTFVLTATAINTYGTVSGFKTVQVLACLPPNPCNINKCYPSYNFYQKGDTVTIGSYSGCDPGLSITGIRWLVVNKYSTEPNPTFIFRDSTRITSGDVIISITGSNGCVYEKNLLSFSIDRTKPINTCIGAICNPTYLQSEIANRQSSIKIYPNPATSELTIETKTTGIFILYSMYGNEAMRWEVITEKEVVNISDLPKGIYFYRFDIWKGKIVKE